MMNNIEFMRRARSIAEIQTLYLVGGFGCRIGKDYYNPSQTWNKNNAALIDAHKNTDPITYGFDCVCLVKGILWGFVADPNKEYGGAKYQSKGVPDYSVSQIRGQCRDLSTDFDESTMVEGELVFLKDNSHIGIYVGNGEVIESTPAWKCCVQKTLLPSRNSSNYEKLPVRKWDLHGKWIDIAYTPNETAKLRAAITDIQKIIKNI